MTPKQGDFIRSLAAERTLPEDTKGAYVRKLVAGDAAEPNAAQASSIIEWLLTLPKAAVVAETTVAEGRYAVISETGVTEFYKVDTPTEGKWAGYVFVKQQASDDLYPVKGARKADVLARIAADPDALARYGQELGCCGRCGRTLTDEVSRATGIGPECAKILGMIRPSVEEVVAHEKRDDLITEALGVAPGETLVIDLDLDEIEAAPSTKSEPRLGWRERKALVEQQQGTRKRRKDGPSSQNAPQPEGFDIFGAPL